jgi:hypothetical protein
VVAKKLAAPADLIFHKKFERRLECGPQAAICWPRDIGWA